VDVDAVAPCTCSMVAASTSIAAFRPRATTSNWPPEPVAMRALRSFAA
jgi:hypothetical protein